MARRHSGARIGAWSSCVLLALAVLGGTKLALGLAFAPPSGDRAAVRIRVDARVARLPERERFFVERAREAQALRALRASGRIPARGLDFVFLDPAGRQIDRFDGVRPAGRILSVR